MVIHERDHCTTIHFIIHGHVTVMKGSNSMKSNTNTDNTDSTIPPLIHSIICKRLLYKHTHNDYKYTINQHFGEHGLIHPTVPYLETVTASSPLELCTLDVKDVYKLCSLLSIQQRNQWLINLLHITSNNNNYISSNSSNNSSNSSNSSNNTSNSNTLVTTDDIIQYSNNRNNSNNMRKGISDNTNNTTSIELDNNTNDTTNIELDNNTNNTTSIELDNNTTNNTTSMELDNTTNNTYS